MRMNDNVWGHLLIENYRAGFSNGLFLLTDSSVTMLKQAAKLNAGAGQRRRFRLCAYRSMDRVGTFGVPAIPT